MQNTTIFNSGLRLRVCESHVSEVAYKFVQWLPVAYSSPHQQNIQENCCYKAAISSKSETKYHNRISLHLTSGGVSLKNSNRFSFYNTKLCSFQFPKSFLQVISIKVHRASTWLFHLLSNTLCICIPLSTLAFVVRIKSL